MILFNTDQSKLMDKLASIAIRDMVTNSKLLKLSMLKENSAVSIVSEKLQKIFSSRYTNFLSVKRN